jgi:hypothetical protein
MAAMISSIADFMIVQYEENGALSRGMCACSVGGVLLSP